MIFCFAKHREELNFYISFLCCAYNIRENLEDICPGTKG